MTGVAELSAAETMTCTDTTCMRAKATCSATTERAAASTTTNATLPPYADDMPVGTLAASRLPCLTHKPPPAPTPRPRTSRDVLEDIFLTHTGCRVLTQFMHHQHLGTALRNSLQAGASFPHPDTQPALPPEIATWLVQLARTRLLPLLAQDERDARRRPRPEPPRRGDGDATATTTPLSDAEMHSLVALLARGTETVADLCVLPALDELPPATRCDLAAARRLHEMLNCYYVQLARLATLTHELRHRWGRLSTRERTMLRRALRAEREAQVSEQSVWDCLNELDLSEQRLELCTDELRRCRRVRTLNLSGNVSLCALAELPPCCPVVVACGCALRHITAPSGALRVLGLAYNQLVSLDFLPLFPQLRSLDVAHNRLDDLDAVIAQVQAHGTLSELTLHGNPVALLDSYRHRLVTGCPRLEKLDDHLVLSDERMPVEVDGNSATAKSSVAAAAAAVTVMGETRTMVGRNARAQGRLSAVQFREPGDEPSTAAQRERQWRALEETVAVALELIAIKGLTSLSHQVPCVSSEDELQPGSGWWQMMVGAGDREGGMNNSSAGGGASPAQLLAAGLLRSAAGGSATIGGHTSHSDGGGRRAAARVGHSVALYECHSTLKIYGNWGGATVVGRGGTAVRQGLEILLDAVELPTSGAAAGLALNSTVGANLATGGGNVARTRRASSVRRLSLNTTAAARRLRKAMATSTTAAPGSGNVEDTLRVPLEQGRFTASLGLHPTLHELLERPIELRVEVHDRLRFLDRATLCARVEGGGGHHGTMGGTMSSAMEGRVRSRGGGRAGGASAVERNTTLPILVEVPAEEHVYTLGTICIDPAALFAQDMVQLRRSESLAAAATAGAGGALETARGVQAALHVPARRGTSISARSAAKAAATTEAKAAEGNVNGHGVPAPVWLLPRRELNVQDCALHANTAALCAEEHALRATKVELCHMTEAYHSLQASLLAEQHRLESTSNSSLHSAMPASMHRLVTPGSGGGAGGEGRLTSATGALTTAASPGPRGALGASHTGLGSNGGASATGTRKPNSARRASRLAANVFSLQQEMHELQERVVASGAKLAAVQRRLGELREARLSVDVALALGRGPTRRAAQEAAPAANGTGATGTTGRGKHASRRAPLAQAKKPA